MEPPSPPPLQPHIAPPPVQHNAGVNSSSVQCITCGYDLSGTAIGSTCPECGTQVATSLRPLTAGPRTSALALASFICGLTSLSIAICFPLGLLGVVAVVLYFPAMKEVKRGDVSGSSKGFAVAGLITGLIGALLSLSCIGVVILAEMNNW